MAKLTVKQAGAYAGVSPALVYQWCQEERLPHYRFGTEGRRGKILIDTADLDEFMRQCRVERSQPAVAGLKHIQLPS